MSFDSHVAPLKQLSLIEPAEILNRAAEYRERSRLCADLATDCVTDSGRHVLAKMAAELREEAHELEESLLRIRKLYSQTI